MDKVSFEASNNGSKDEFAALERLQNEDFHIMTCYGKCQFKPGQSFRARITHIYDISKFWMVIKYQELEIFQKYLFRWYYANKKKYRIPVDKIKTNMYCVVLNDGGYYRGVIIGAPCDHQKEPEVQIYFLDYGLLKTVETNKLFYLNKQCFQVPQFAVRASLADICPLNAHQWTNESVIEFHNLVNNKCLAGVVLHIDVERQVLYVRLCEEKGVNLMNVPLSKTLVTLKHARYYHDKVEIVNDKLSTDPQLKFPYLFPSHAVIESGKVPTTLSDSEYQLQVSSMPVIARYYKSNNPDKN